MKEKESDKAHRIAISKHFPVSYYGVSMAPSGPRTIAQVCTLEYCHPANGNKGPKQDNPQRKHGLGGEGCNRGGKWDLWNANWASSPYWSGKRVPIVPLNRGSSGMRCEGTVCLVTPHASNPDTVLCCGARREFFLTIRSLYRGYRPFTRLAAGHMINCLIHLVWGCVRRALLQVYMCISRSIFLTAHPSCSEEAVGLYCPRLFFLPSPLCSAEKAN